MVVRKTSLRVLSVCVLSNQQPKLQEVQRKIYGSVVIHADCRCWFHAGCGGVTANQYHKITKDNIWIKCVVCCLHQLQLTVCDDDHTSLCSSVEEALKRRGCESSRFVHKSETIHHSIHEKLSASNSNTDASHCESVSDLSQISQVDANIQQSDDTTVTVAGASDVDKVLVIDNIDIAVEYSLSRRILQEVHKYCPNISRFCIFAGQRGCGNSHCVSK